MVLWLDQGSGVFRQSSTGTISFITGVREPTLLFTEGGDYHFQEEATGPAAVPPLGPGLGL